MPSEAFGVFTLYSLDDR